MTIGKQVKKMFFFPNLWLDSYSNLRWSSLQVGQCSGAFSWTGAETALRRVGADAGLVLIGQPMGIWYMKPIFPMHGANLERCGSLLGQLFTNFLARPAAEVVNACLALSPWPPSLGYLGEDLPGSRFYPCGWCFGCYYWPRSRSLGHVGTLGSSSGGSASTTETVECRPCHPWQLDQSAASALVSLGKCSTECAAIDWSASGGCQSCFVCELCGGIRSLNIMAVDHTLIYAIPGLAAARGKRKKAMENQQETSFCSKSM